MKSKAVNGVSGMLIVLIQGFIGLLIIIGKLPVEAMAWVWFIGGLITFVALLLIGSVAIMKDN